MIFARKESQQQLLPFPKQVFISVSRTARLLECSNDTVYRLIQEGRISAYRLRAFGWWRVDYESVVQYLQLARTCTL